MVPVGRRGDSVARGGGRERGPPMGPGRVGLFAAVPRFKNRTAAEVRSVEGKSASWRAPDFDSKWPDPERARLQRWRPGRGPDGMLHLAADCAGHAEIARSA